MKKRQSLSLISRLFIITALVAVNLQARLSYAADPVVDLGGDEALAPGATDHTPLCTASDADEDPLVYTWAIIQGNNASFATDSPFAPSAPLMDFQNFSGAYRINCTVDDGFVGVPDEKILYSTDTTTRLSGATRYDTAVAISQNRSFTNATPSVVIASGENFPDALAAAPLAALVNSPILLVKHNDVSASVLAEINRIWNHDNSGGATDIYIIGGTSSINASVSDAIAAGIDGSPNITRIAGANRYETATAIATEMNSIAGAPDKVVVVNGSSFADAAAMASPASNWWLDSARMPILLNDGGTLRPENTTYLDSVNASVGTVYIGGGTSAISGTAETSLGGYGTVTRLAGANRYETAQAIANFFYAPLSYPAPINVGVASGTDFPDALTGGLFSGYTNMPLLYVNGAVPTETSTYLIDATAQLHNAFVFGGSASVSDTVENSLINTINCSSIGASGC